MKSHRRPEVLAPAGDRAALEAAVRAGADAVYFGLQGNNFNARARATNFDAASLGETLHYLHAHGRRGYVTLNTLVFDEELPAVENAIRACAAAGVDAVIVQDLAVAELCRAIAPSLPVHASTQMTCTDVDSVALAARLGATRVILARELSLDEISAIVAASEIEVEVFVHGALCIAYSGQCLTSEAIGGRSANRGACAQACRLPYELVVDGELRPTGDAAYLLSPEDLETSAHVPRLVQMGIASLKIEGRLKGPDYVAATTRLYQQAIASALGEIAPPDEAMRQRALQTFSRGSGPGFFLGVDHQRLVDGETCDHRGVEVGTLLGQAPHDRLRVALSTDVQRGDGIIVSGTWGGENEVGGHIWQIALDDGSDVERATAGSHVALWLGPDKRLPRVPLEPGRRIFRNRSHANEKAIAEIEQHSPSRRPLDLALTGAHGGAVTLAATTHDGRTATVTLDAPLGVATTRALDPAILADKLGRLGDTPYALGALKLDVPTDAVVPLSALNRARRAIVVALDAAATRSHAMTSMHAADVLTAVELPPRAPAPSGLFVLCRTLPQAEAAIAAGADGVYLDFLALTGTGEATRALRSNGAKSIGLAPPRIRKPGEEKIDRFLATLLPEMILVRGLGALAQTADDQTAALRIGDFSLNVTNRITAARVLSLGLAAFTPSFDLDSTQLLALVTGPLAPWAEVVVHHPMPLFHMEHCVIAALLSDGRDHKTCGRPCEHHAVSLRDRAGHDHPVEADVGCRNTVFHAAAQSAADLVPKLRRAGVGRYRIELVRETPAQVAELVTTYRALSDGALSPQDVWRRLRVPSQQAGGYGVVRGSLRVVQ